MRFPLPQDLPHTLAAGFQEHLPGALAALAGEEAHQKLVAGEGAVGHVGERQRVGQPARAVEIQPVREQEQAYLRAADGVVAVRDGVDDGLVHHVDVVGGRSAIGTSFLHELRDEGGGGVDLVGNGASEAFNVRQMVGREFAAGVTGGFYGAGGQKIRRFGGEREQPCHRRAILALFVRRGDTGVAQQIQPRDGRRTAKECFETMLVEGRNAGCEHRSLVEDVLAAALLEQAHELRWREIALRAANALIVAPSGGAMHIEATRNLRKNQVFARIAVSHYMLADDGADGRVAVLRGDVDKPSLHRVKALLGDAQRHTGIIHAEEQCAAIRVGERHHLAGHGFGVRCPHATARQPQLFELSAAVFACEKLALDLFGGVEHGDVVRCSVRAVRWSPSYAGLGAAGRTGTVSQAADSAQSIAHGHRRTLVFDGVVRRRNLRPAAVRR